MAYILPKRSYSTYLMYTQIYFHDVRRIYDIHLKNFLLQWLPNGKFPITIDKHLSLTDNEVISAIRENASKKNSKCHEPAKRIEQREHFRTVYELSLQHIHKQVISSKLLLLELKNNLGKKI